MALNAGVLSVTVEFAKGLKDADLFSKIDPYAVLKVGSQTFRTRALQGAGTSPVWNETFAFNIINENNLEITFFDEDVVSDDNLGDATIPLAKVRSSKTDHLQASIIRKTSKKLGGFVSVSLKFEPNDELKPHAPAPVSTGYAQPSMHTPQGYAHPPYAAHPSHGAGQYAPYASHYPVAAPYYVPVPMPMHVPSPYPVAAPQYMHMPTHMPMPAPHASPYPVVVPQYMPMHMPTPYGTSPYGGYPPAR